MRSKNVQACALALALALALPSVLPAASLIQARSEIPATVIMDGTPMGITPLNISQVAPGDHEIAFQVVGSRVMRAYRVRIPFSASTSTTVEADFTNQGPLVVEAMPIVAGPPVVCRPVIVRPAVLAAPVVLVPPGRGRAHGRRRHRW